MGATRREIDDTVYNERHENYIKNREKILARAKIRYQEERPIRIVIERKIREAVRQQRLKEKRRVAYQGKSIPMVPNARAKEFVQTYKEGKLCLDCGQQHPYYVMDFDHVRGTKECDISTLVAKGKTIKKILIEMEKCDLVCTNCHRERSHQRMI